MHGKDAVEKSLVGESVWFWFELSLVDDKWIMRVAEML
jgi:hypothetical protein